MAYDDGYYFGQCKLVCTAEGNIYDGCTVTVTAVDNSNVTRSGIITGGRAIITVPGRNLYRISVLRSGSQVFTREVEAGYGDCLTVLLADGYQDLKKKDAASLAEIEQGTGIADKVTSAQASKDILGKLGGCSLEESGGNFYIVGADSVRKKLGDGNPAIVDVSATAGGQIYESNKVNVQAELALTLKVSDYDSVKAKITKQSYDYTNITRVEAGYTSSNAEDFNNPNPAQWKTVGNISTESPFDISKYGYIRIFTSGNKGYTYPTIMQHITAPKLSNFEWS